MALQEIEFVSEGFWIFKPNLIPLLIILSELTVYDFSESDVDAIMFGLESTSNERGIWFDYVFFGKKKITLKLAYDHDNPNIIFLNLTFDKKLADSIDICIFAVQAFDLKSRHFKG